VLARGGASHIVVVFNPIVMALSPTPGAHICWCTWHHG